MPKRDRCVLCAGGILYWGNYSVTSKENLGWTSIVSSVFVLTSFLVSRRLSRDRRSVSLCWTSPPSQRTTTSATRTLFFVRTSRSAAALSAPENDANCRCTRPRRTCWKCASSAGVPRKPRAPDTLYSSTKVHYVAGISNSRKQILSVSVRQWPVILPTQNFI